MNIFRPSGAFRIAALYAVAAGLWILFSDRLLFLLAPDQEVISALSLYKGWAFVAVTSYLLYWERSRSDKKLRESEERYRNLFDVMDEGMAINEAVFDENGDVVDYRILSVNPGFEKHSPYKMDEAIGRLATDLYQMDAEYIRRWWKDHIQFQEAAHTEMFHEPSGRWFDITTTPPKEKQFATIFTNITERKLAEEKLRESEEKYRTLVEGLDNIITIVDSEGVHRFMNRAAAAALGGTPESLANKRMDELFPPEVAEHQLANIRQVIDSGNVAVIDSRSIVKGDPRWYRTSIHPIRDADGRVASALVNALDITKRKQAEEALQKSEASLNRAQAVAHVGSWNLDISQDALVWSAETHRIFDVPIGTQLTYEAFLSHVHPDDVESVNRAWMSALQGAPYDIEHRILAGGQTKWVRERAELEMGADGQALCGIGTVQDITERKQAEERLKSRVNELNAIYQASQRLQKLLPPDALAAEIVQVLEKTLSYEHGAVLLIDEASQNLIPFAIVGTDGTKDSVKKDRDYILSRQPRVGRGITGWVAEHGESVCLGDVREDGRYFSVRKDILSELCVPLRTGDKIIGVINIEATRADAYSDYDQRVLETIAAQIAIAIQNADLLEETRKLNAELEQRVVARTSQLVAANKELEAFTYSVSHDLRAPLRAIDGYTRILVEDYESVLDAEGRRTCNVIRGEARRMGRLIDDLLNLSRLNRAEIQFIPIDMAAMARSVFEDLMRNENRERNEFTVGEMPSIMGDPSLMRQVWINLLNNAIKFTSKKDRAVIETGCRQSEGESIFFVRDNGAGFDMQYQNKLFGVFQRLHSESEYEGTGVGLAIVQRVIHRHGGRAWAEGRIGEGATFYFALPRVEQG